MTKLLPLSEAIDQFVNDDDTVYAAGFTHLIPFAAGHEIIRQHKKNLTLARATPDLIYDQMVAAGCARKVIFSYMGNPDVAIVHVQRADAQGNAHLWGIIGEQKEAAFAAKKVILTAEEIVDESVIRSDPNRTMIPGIIVSVVCHVPYACHPSYAQGYYDRDNEFYLGWDKISESPEAVKQYLDEWVYGVKDRAEYWKKLGARERLKVKPQMSEPINYGRY
jgi:glutaconate CoA-transferase subunit A